MAQLIESHEDTCARDPMCLSRDEIPLLKNVRTSLIDPTTPEFARKKIAADGTEWTLVVGAGNISPWDEGC